MSKELWEQQLELWRSQDRMNALHSASVDDLTKQVIRLAEIVGSIMEREAIRDEAVKPVCTGKQCRCGKVAH